MRVLMVVTAVTVAVSGCYSYVPVQSSTVPTGVRANVVLTDEGTTELARLLGPSSHVVEGDVVTMGEDALTLAVRRLERYNGVEEFWKGENVTIRRASVANITERRFSRSRTAIASVGIGAVLFVIADAFGATDAIFGRGAPGPVTER